MQRSFDNLLYGILLETCPLGETHARPDLIDTGK